MAKLIKIFDFHNYKDFIAATLRAMPKQGYGQSSRIAQALGVHTTMVTHVLKGDLHFNTEQALALADFLGLNPLETRYLLALVQRDRAGDSRTRAFFETQILDLKEQSLNLKARMQIKNVLDESDQAIYYSSWMYAALRLLSAIPAYQSASAMALHLNFPLAKVNKALDFLISCGLCEERDGKIVYGEISTYVETGTPLAIRHHMNWRTKAMEQFETLNSNELVYTNPVVIAEKDLPKIRELILNFIEEIKNVTDPSPSEKLFCLNIDWVQIDR